jgi:hypothetical protein
MNLSDKIEEIRQKPEHEKIRYVWGMVAISMVLIVSIWVISFKGMFQGREMINSGSDVMGGLEKIENTPNTDTISDNFQSVENNNSENTNK